MSHPFDQGIYGVTCVHCGKPFATRDKNPDRRWCQDCLEEQENSDDGSSAIASDVLDREDEGGAA